MTDLNPGKDTLRGSEYGRLALQDFGHPDDVLMDQRLTTEEKRALLASWASDVNAVSHIPTLRQLPDGSIVKVEEIFRALKALDGAAETRLQHVGEPFPRQRPLGRYGGWGLRRWLRSDGRRDDDDDDPPPCPVHAAVPPLGGGGGAVAFAEAA
jgi:hypothetical protein